MEGWRRDYFKANTGSCSGGGWQVQNLHGSSAGWRPGEELMLQLKSKGGLEAEFFLPQVTSVFSTKAFD